MARARILKPGFFTNELLAELPFEGRLLFAGLWTLADREGRLEERPKRIKAAVFPFDEVDVTGLLDALELKGFITRYSGDGLPLIQIAKFAEHQTPHARETASTLPSPEPRKGSAQPLPRSPVYGNGSSSVTGSGNGSDCTELRSAPPFLTFKVTGKGPKEWVLSSLLVAEWQLSFPTVDVAAECRKAHAWIDANPSRAKTFSGMKAFLVNWFNRTVNRRSGDDRRQFTERRQPERDYQWPCPHGLSHSESQCQVQQILEAARKDKTA